MSSSSVKLEELCGIINDVCFTQDRKRMIWAIVSCRVKRLSPHLLQMQIKVCPHCLFRLQPRQMPWLVMQAALAPSSWFEPGGLGHGCGQR